MASSFRALMGIPASTASTTDSTLLIIDAQNEYATGALRTEDVAATSSAIAGLLDKYRRAGGSVVHIVHDVPAGAPVFTPGTALAEEMGAVRARDGEVVVRKKHPGGFTGTELEEVLEGMGKGKVVLTGYMAHVCVSTTARQAAERGYDVLLAEDAIGDRHIPGVDAANLIKVVLAELADAFGTVIQGSSVV